MSSEDNLHEMSKPIFRENKKDILKCHLLKVLTSLLSIKIFLSETYLSSSVIVAQKSCIHIAMF